MKETGESYRVESERGEALRNIEVPVTGDAGGGHEEESGRCGLLFANKLKHLKIDLNKEVENAAENNDFETGDNFEDLPLSGKGDKVASRGMGLNLTVKDVSRSVNQDQFDVNENCDRVNMREISECGSTAWPLEERNSMIIGKEKKRKSPVLSSYGGIPLPIPKQRERRAMKNIDKKIAEREQVEGAEINHGLLKGLNPGILNHVRNRKQVCSIIKAMVQSENLGDGHPGSEKKNHVDDGNKEVGSMAKSSSGTQSHLVHGDDRPRVQLSSLNEGPENPSSLSNEESANHTSVSSLSLKAATVALQWLELLRKDIKGRLSALRRSKDKVHAVITTEFPLLVSKEFSSNQENDGYVCESTGDRSSTSSSAEVHQTKWSALFNQMHESLCEEQGQLEIWLDQVVKMIRHCEEGLHQFPMNVLCCSQQLGVSASDHRMKKMDYFENELATMAAAASIYSTCTFLSAKENAPG